MLGWRTLSQYTLFLTIAGHKHTNINPATIDWALYIEYELFKFIKIVAKMSWALMAATTYTIIEWVCRIIYKGFVS